MRIFGLFILIMTLALPAHAKGGFRFDSIDGGQIALDDWRGQPVLVANTASLCAFTPQYEDLQALYDRYKDRGLVVLAVASDDFGQELDSNSEVKNFCDANFDLDFPMTEITHVRGPRAHPFYKWLASEHGFTPAWNFNKVLLNADGDVVGTWGSMAKPTSRAITREIEPLLPR